MPAAAGSLLDAAAEMGYHVLGLSYASLPTAVSMMNIWCTRPGADAARCNAELHESVLYGAPPDWVVFHETVFTKHELIMSGTKVDEVCCPATLRAAEPLP